MDRHDLYELCVQSPKDLVPLLSAIHRARPRVLAEDFAGTAALSCAWVASDDSLTAVAVDLDAVALGKHGEHDRITRHAADVRSITDPADVLFVGNFSIGYLHTRAELIAYLRHARSRVEASGGVFICDTYGGESAFLTGHVHRAHPIPKSLDGIGGRICRYTWEQRDADPLTGMVTDVIHFRIERAGVITDELDDAFVYRWRLWSVPELRDAMHEAGFGSTQVFSKLADAVDAEGNAYAEPVSDPEDLEDSFIVLVVARCDAST